MKIACRCGSDANPLVMRTELNGWPKSLGGNCLVAWDFIFKAAERWTLVSLIFGSDEDYKVALSAYYMSLHVLEFACRIANGQGENLKDARLTIPVCFIETGEEVTNQAYRLFLRSNPE